MNIYSKILAATLPLVVLIFMAAVGTTYYFAGTALTELAEIWLETRLSEALQIASEHESILHRYELGNVSASIAKAQIDTGTAVSAIDVGERGYIFAIDDRGVIVMHPDENQIGRDVKGSSWYQRITPMPGRLRYREGGEAVLGVYDHFTPWNWVILAIDPERDVYGAINRVKPYLVFLVVAGIMVTAAVLMGLTRRITQPLHFLILGADRIGKGEYGFRIAVRSRDEFGRLATVFNQMGVQLGKTHQELEERVLERTKELTRVNSQLQERIKERNLAVETREEREQQLRAILRASPVGIGLVVNRSLDWANATMYQLVGYEENTLVGKSARILYPDEAEYERVGSEVLHKVRAGEIAQVETRWVRKDGTVFDCSLRAFPLDSGDLDKGVIVAVADVSEGKRLEARLQRAQKMEAIGTLAGGVAHDLNNILSGIVSYPELLLMDLPESSPLRKPLLTIKQSGERAATIVQDLLTMARRGVAVADLVDLNEVITVQLESPECRQLRTYHPEVEFAVDLAVDLLPIKGSVAHLSKCIMNIVANGAESMPEGGTVAIATKNVYWDRPVSGLEHVKEGEYVAVVVADQGVGISAADQERIFEPFYTKKTMGRSGTGLGMAVVWGTVQDHGGFIEVESIENKGTTFTLFFPASSEKPVSRAQETAPSYQGSGESILVVDDSAMQREVARNILFRLGYRVATVASGEEAVEYVKEHDVDLVVLDMIMAPGMDGLDTFKQITAFEPGQQFIVASGFSESDRVREMQKVSRCQYLKKPYTIEKIGLAVRRALAV